MKKFIFYTIKSVQNYCYTFLCCCKAIFSSITNVIPIQRVSRLCLNYWQQSFALPIMMIAAILMTAYTTSAQNIQGRAPVQAPKGGFAIDGNAFAKWPGPPLPADNSAWGDFLFEAGYTVTDSVAYKALSPGGIFVPVPPPYTYPDGPLPMVGKPNRSGSFYVYPLTTFFRDNITINDPTIFTSTNKINDNISSYSWGMGSSPNKNEIQNAIAHFTYGDATIQAVQNGVSLLDPETNLPLMGNPDHLWLIFAADRQVTDGSSYIDFEILQKRMEMIVTGKDSKGYDKGIFESEATSPTNPSGRTIGDLLITVEFTKGGVSANVVVRRWTGTAYGDPVTPTPGTLYGTNNTAQTIVPYPIYNQAPFATSPVKVWAYEPNQWAEGAVNITKIFEEFGPADECFTISTLFVRTRTSGSSGQSELKDFPGAPFQLNLCSDKIPPELTCLAGRDFGCNPNPIPEPETPTATDNCSTPTVVPSSVTVPNGCLRTRTTTFTATDACGNAASCTQVDTWTVVTAPVLANLPTGGALGCNPTPPVCNTAVTASNECGAVTPVTCTPGTITAVGCNRTQIFTYSATACGLTTSQDVTYTWTVVTAPVLANLPTGGALGCNPTPPVCSTAVTASNECGAVTPVTCTPGSIIIDGCNRSQTFTYSATACGLSGSGTATYTWTVVTAPVLAGVPAGGPLGCNPTPPTCDPNVTASNECGAVEVTCTPGSITSTESSRSQTFTYSATACGLSTSATVTYTWEASCVHIFPTNTTCTDFSTGIAVGLPRVCTTLDDNGKVSQNVNPGVFFYYSFVTVPPGAFTIDVKQTNDGKLDKLFTVQGYSGNTSQIRLSTSSCGTVLFTPSFIDSGSGARLTGTNSSGANATYIVSIKYEVKSIVGAAYSGANTSSTYTFASYVNGSLSAPSTGTINAEICSSTPLIPLIAPTETSLTSKTESVGFEAYPVPFRDQLTIKYNFDYVSDVKIEVFNVKGNVIFSKTDAEAYLNKEVSLNLPNTGQSEVYIVKVTTDRGSSTKKVISSR
jgi:hypothetical protein